MFSGIVEEIGKVKEIIELPKDKILIINAHTILNGIKIGDSISVNGCCLTVVTFEDHSFTVQVVYETLKRSNINRLKIDSKVNLERSITMNQRIGGHLVQGHVDSMVKIISIESQGNSKIVRFNCSSELAPYVVNKGYIALDGMSITVIEVGDSWFSVMLIPHTLQHTTAHEYTIGQKINVEVDIIGRYIEKFLIISKKV
jgi:riboflavin synthase